MTLYGGIGIHIANGLGKVVDSYLDFCPLVVDDPQNCTFHDSTSHLPDFMASLARTQSLRQIICFSQEGTLS